MRGKVGADLSCRRQGGGNPFSTRLSRLDNRNVIIGCLKRQLCQGLREETRRGFGVIVMEITAALEYHKAFPPVSWNSVPQPQTVQFGHLPKSARAYIRACHVASSVFNSV